nr:F-box containing protein [Marseillevirus futianmevirus]
MQKHTQEKRKVIVKLGKRIALESEIVSDIFGQQQGLEKKTKIVPSIVCSLGIAETEKTRETRNYKSHGKLLKWKKCGLWETEELGMSPDKKVCLWKDGELQVSHKKLGDSCLLKCGGNTFESSVTPFECKGEKHLAFEDLGTGKTHSHCCSKHRGNLPDLLI